MKLFDIPGLGRLIGAASTGVPRAYDSEGKPLTPGLYSEAQRGRKPNILIPKVGGISISYFMDRISSVGGLVLNYDENGNFIDFVGNLDCTALEN